MIVKINQEKEERCENVLLYFLIYVMDLVIKRLRCLPCNLEEFVINGKKARVSDFGETITDVMEGTCCCKFQYKLPTQEILDQYGIDLKDYSDICERLEEELDIYNCHYCS